MYYNKNRALERLTEGWLYPDSKKRGNMKRLNIERFTRNSYIDNLYKYLQENNVDLLRIVREINRERAERKNTERTAIVNE